MGFWNVSLSLLSGFQTTILLFALTLLFALPLGLVISFGSMSRFTPLRLIVKIFVWIIRGTPLMLQVIIIFYVPGLLFGSTISTRFNAAPVYLAEITRVVYNKRNEGGVEPG